MVDAFSTQVLNRVIEDMPDATTFLVDTFFPEVDVQDSDTIMFDTTSGRKLVTPFVSPLAEAPVIGEAGYETDSFSPAYLKDKRLFNANMGTKRLPGEKIGGELTPMQRVDRAIKRNLAEQIKMISGRLECMAGEILTTGKSTITGERYPTKVLDFKRRAENTVIKGAGTKWTDAGVSPYDDVEAEAQELADATGFAPTDVVFGKEAWKLYKKDLMSEAHKDEFDSTLKNLSLNEIHMSYVLQPRDGVIYRGRVGYLSLWTYSGTYTDPENGAVLKPLGDYDVLIGGASIDGVRHFGRIKDLSAQLAARQYFVKSRELFDPSGYEFFMQSAPLLVPYRRNNVKRLKVA
jgi:hypothetical protein